MRYDIPIWEKSNLTLDEAAAYTGVGIKKLREVSNDEDCEFVLWIGSKRLLKRKKLDEFIDDTYSL
jgi:excisionase family DNA binding protein